MSWNERADGKFLAVADARQTTTASRLLQRRNGRRPLGNRNGLRWPTRSLPHGSWEVVGVSQSNNDKSMLALRNADASRFEWSSGALSRFGSWRCDVGDKKLQLHAICIIRLYYWTFVELQAGIDGSPSIKDLSNTVLDMPALSPVILFHKHFHRRHWGVADSDLSYVMPQVIKNSA